MNFFVLSWNIKFVLLYFFHYSNSFNIKSFCISYTMLFWGIQKKSITFFIWILRKKVIRPQSFSMEGWLSRVKISSNETSSSSSLKQLLSLYETTFLVIENINFLGSLSSSSSVSNCSSSSGWDASELLGRSILVIFV